MSDLTFTEFLEATVAIEIGEALLAPSVVQPAIPLPCQISDDVVLRELTDEEAAGLFHRTNRRFNHAGRLISSQRLTPDGIPAPNEQALYWQLASSRFGYEVASKLDPTGPPPKALQQLNFALMICLKPGGGLMMAAPIRRDQTLGPSRDFFPPFAGVVVFPRITERESGLLREVLACLRSSTQDLEFFSQLLGYAVSAGVETAVRCMTLITILETLFVTDRKNFGHRLVIRAAKMLNKPEGWFQKMETIYQKWGDFLHEGKSIFSKEDYDFLLSAAQESLMLKILSPTLMDIINFDESEPPA